LPDAAGLITFKEDLALPLPEEMQARFPATTPLAQGVRETIEMLAGRVAP
jgi:hypothetical protein